MNRHALHKRWRAARHAWRSVRMPSSARFRRIIGRGLAGWLLAGLLLGPAVGQVVQIQIDPPADWWSAIRRDDARTVQDMLLRRVDPAALNDQGNPALTQAARDQSWQVFDLLATTAGVDVDQANALNETPLMYLAILGETERAKKLIQAGAQVNRLGWTPLHYAASKAQMGMAQLLIDRGAIINAPGPDGTTPLMMAALSGKQEMATLLLSQGADPTMFNVTGETAVDWANKQNHQRMAAWLAAESQAFAARRQAGAQAARPRAGHSIAELLPRGIPGSNSIASELPQQQAAPRKDESSFSRYFDLDRFDHTPAGMQ